MRSSRTVEEHKEYTCDCEENEEKKDSRVKKLVEISKKLEGLNRNMATHAAGVVIAGDKLAEQFPLYVDHGSNLVLPSTQYDMYSSENAGLVKFDLLGLKTLTVIDKTLKRLKTKNIVSFPVSISIERFLIFENIMIQTKNKFSSIFSVKSSRIIFS